MFRVLDAEFRFTIDAAAHAQNNRLDRWWGPGGVKPDGLRAPWLVERVFCNPPWSNVAAWTRRAWHETRVGACPLAVLVVPSDTSTAWWHDWVLRGPDGMMGASEIRFVRGRVDYLRPGARRRSGGQGPRQATAIVVYWGFARFGLNDKPAVPALPLLR